MNELPPADVGRMTTSVDLTDHVAIVTGASRGLGRVYARALASAGAAVAAVARSAEQLEETVSLIQESGGCARAFPADVTDSPAIERIVDEVETRLGPIGLLVNNAAVTAPLGPVWEVDPDEWWRCMDVNLRGPFLCSRTVLPAMIGRRRGRIVNVASGAGTEAVPHASAYVVSKTALLRLTEGLAAEAAAHGIGVFAIAPSTVRTAMTEYILESPAGRRWLPWFRRIFEGGRDEPPERSAELLLLVASGAMDALSGRFVTTADDLTQLVERSEEIRRDDLYTLRLGTLGRGPVGGAAFRAGAD